MGLNDPIMIDLANPPEVAPELAFAPLHKRALGMAVGITAGLLVFVGTIFHQVIHSHAEPNVGLLAEYFYGYSVSVQGAFIGLLWGFSRGS